MTEAELQAEVMALAARLGLKCLHVREPRREGGDWPGFPDLVIVGRRVIYRELKMAGKEPSAGQRAWLEILTRAGQDAAVWKPADWPAGDVERELHNLAALDYTEPEHLDPQQRLWRALRKAASTD
jgi:hypothetical protein